MKHTGLFLSLLLPVIVFAQDKPSGRTIENIAEKLFVTDDAQALVLSVIDSAVCVVRKDYVLKDPTGKRTYGKKNKDYYGRFYFPGFYSGNKLWVTALAETPWLQDGKYLGKYKDSLKPVITGSSYRAVYSGTYRQLGIAVKSKDSSVVCYDSVSGMKNLDIMFNQKDTSGYLLLLAASPSFEDHDSTSIQRRIVKVKTVFPDSVRYGLPMNIKPDSNTIGGIYFSAVKDTGKLQLKPSGMLVMNRGSWVIIPFYDGAPAVKKDDDKDDLIQKN